MLRFGKITGKEAGSPVVGDERGSTSGGSHNRKVAVHMRHRTADSPTFGPTYQNYVPRIAWIGIHATGGKFSGIYAKRVRGGSELARKYAKYAEGSRFLGFPPRYHSQFPTCRSAGVGETTRERGDSAWKSASSLITVERQRLIHGFIFVNKT